MMKRMICVLAVISMLILPYGSLAADGPAKEVEGALNAYFDLKYGILSSLVYDPQIEKMMDSGALASADAINEADVLGTVVSYRKSQINDLRFEKFNYTLRFENVKADSDQASAVFSEESEIWYKCAPTVRSKTAVQHIVRLSKTGGKWLLVNDDYTDPDGIKLLFNTVFLSEDVTKEKAAELVLEKLNGQADTRLEKLAALMKAEGGAGMSVFCVGKNAAYIGGKACRIDDNPGVAPVVRDGAVLLPVRFIAEKLGAPVTWEKATSMVRISRQGHEILFRPDSDFIVLDGTEILMETPIRVIEGRAMLPADMLAKMFGLTVYQDGNGIIILSADSAGQPDKALAGKLKVFFDVLYTKADFPHIDGSTATYPLSIALGKELLGLDDTGAKGFITHRTTHDAYVNLINGNADIIFVTQPSPEELALAEKAGIGLEVVPVCNEGFVFLVNGENPVKGLTVPQVQDIYRGKIKNWKEVGGEDGAVIAYQREANSGSQTIMENTVMKGIKMVEPPKEQLVYGMGALIDKVADFSNSKNALGYSVYYYATSMYQNRAVRLLPINGVAPSPGTIRDGTYPFVVKYYAVIRKSEEDGSSARRLLGWLLGPEGQSLVDQAGFVALK